MGRIRAREKACRRKAKGALRKARRECAEAIGRFDAFEAAMGTVRGALECVDVASGELHRPEQVEAWIAQAAGRIGELGTGECVKLARYLRNRGPGLALAQKSVLPRLEALGERWSMPAVSLGCLCWYLVRALKSHPPHARHRALSRHLLGAYAALRDQLGPESDSLLDAVEAVLHRRHRASSAIEGFNAALRPYLYVHKGATQGFLDLFPCLVQPAHAAVGTPQGKEPPRVPDRTARRRLAHAARLPALAGAPMTRRALTRPHPIGPSDPEHDMPRDTSTRLT